MFIQPRHDLDEIAGPVGCVERNETHHRHRGSAMGIASLNSSYGHDVDQADAPFAFGRRRCSSSRNLDEVAGPVVLIMRRAPQPPHRPSATLFRSLNPSYGYDADQADAPFAFG